MTTVRSAEPDDDVAGILRHSWGESVIAVHGRLFDAARLPALVACDDDGQVVGVLTYDLAGVVLEIVSCDAAPPGRGTGRTLVRRAIDLARDADADRVVCTTTNDNLPALGFWQAMGFALVGVRPDAVAAARRLKPSIPYRGHRGLPVRDELDLAMSLSRSAARAATPSSVQ